MSSSSAALSLEKTETPESNAPTSSGSEAPGDAIDTTLPQIRRLSSSDIRGKKKIVRKRRTMVRDAIYATVAVHTSSLILFGDLCVRQNFSYPHTRRLNTFSFGLGDNFLRLFPTAQVEIHIFYN